MPAVEGINGKATVATAFPPYPARAMVRMVQMAARVETPTGWPEARVQMEFLAVTAVVVVKVDLLLVAPEGLAATVVMLRNPAATAEMAAPAAGAVLPKAASAGSEATAAIVVLQKMVLATAATAALAA